jgi:hypothetical protein
VFEIVRVSSFDYFKGSINQSAPTMELLGTKLLPGLDQFSVSKFNLPNEACTLCGQFVRHAS